MSPAWVTLAHDAAREELRRLARVCATPEHAQREHRAELEEAAAYCTRRRRALHAERVPAASLHNH